MENKWNLSKPNTILSPVQCWPPANRIYSFSYMQNHSKKKTHTDALTIHHQIANKTARTDDRERAQENNNITDMWI